MKHIVRYADIKHILEKHDLRHAQEAMDPKDVECLRVTLRDYFSDKERKRAVLGMDIYQYSRMPPETQNIIPSLFKFIHEEAHRLSLACEPAIFASTDERRIFVSTGDGGFQVFETPLQAVVFAIFFEWYLLAFNSYQFLPRLRQMFDQVLIVRYALTYDVLFEQDSNVFGAAIINNSRIIGRDTLNRFLLDSNAVEWFRVKMVSVESLVTLRLEDLTRIVEKNHHALSVTNSQLFGSRREEQGVRSVHLQKIGVVTSKESKLDIYSLMLQVAVAKHTIEAQPAGTAIVTVGNLNPSGLDRAG